MKRSIIEKRLKEQEKVRPRQRQRPGIIEYHYPMGATKEEMDRLASEAKAAYMAEHPECDPRYPALCLGLPYEPEPENIFN
jgi:hypothetical protein